MPSFHSCQLGAPSFILSTFWPLLLYLGESQDCSLAAASLCYICMICMLPPRCPGHLISCFLFHCSRFGLLLYSPSILTRFLCLGRFHNRAEAQVESQHSQLACIQHLVHAWRDKCTYGNLEDPKNLKTSHLQGSCHRVHLLMLTPSIYKEPIILRSLSFCSAHHLLIKCCSRWECF